MSRSRIRRPAELSDDPAAHAERARLHYVDDAEPGMTRRRHGRGFVYLDADGRVIRNRKVLARVRSLRIPPAWERVWICSRHDGHLQATGRDARGRKQFRYHARWKEFRDETKYNRVIDFAHALPRIRKSVRRDLRRRGLPRSKVLAAIIRLLESTLIRVGNEEYARTNRSYGLTTMRNRHARVSGPRIRFSFLGKGGVAHEIDLKDQTLAAIVRRCQELPGQQLFEYLDERGVVRQIGSTDVNEYLREISGRDFTAKDFRTWAGTFQAARMLREFEDFESPTAARRNIATAIGQVAERLGNTRTVCRKCYVHPAIVEAYLDRSLPAALRRRANHGCRRSSSSLATAEAAVLALLEPRQRSQPRAAARARRRRRMPETAAAGKAA